MIIIFMFAKSFFSKARQLFRSFRQRHISQTKSSKNLYFASLSILPISLYLGNKVINCKESKDSQNGQDILQLVSMSQLVSLLNTQSSKDFVVLVYNKFQKINHPEAFTALLKEILEECKRINIDKIYAISSRQQQYLREIARRLRSQPAESNQSQQDASKKRQSKKKKVIECYFKNKSYEQAFELLNSKDYKISQQIQQIRHFQIKVNNPKLVEQLTAFSSLPFDINKSIVVKKCTGQGECVQSYKKQVRNLLNSGLLIKKSQQYQFQLVINYPTGILNKSSQYIKQFQSCVTNLAHRPIPHKKEETFLFRSDIIGKETLFFSQWIEKDENTFQNSDNFFMFIRPRVNIISRLNTFTDLQWYFMVTRLSNNLSFSINNTEKWSKHNKIGCLDTLKLLYSYYPRLNYLIVNSSSVGDIITHVHANHKYTIFQQSIGEIWKKKFLNLELLQKAQTPQERQSLFKTNFKQQIDSFIKNPESKDLVLVEKQLQISFQKLKLWKEQQKISQKSKRRLIRVCEDKCLRYMDDQLVEKVGQKTNQITRVYWIDSKTQNVGVKPGDYLLAEGKLVQISQLLKN